MLSLEDINAVRKEIYSARAKWQDIALELKMPLDNVDNIKSRCTEDKDCLLEALRWWLKRANPKPGWSDLIDALRSPIVDENHLADDLQRKYYHQGNFI